jgi:tetratricopeptide (TPR) repeat protein
MPARDSRPQNYDWLENLDSGLTAAESGHDHEALKHFEQALEIAVAIGLTTDDLLKTYLAYAITLRNCGRLDESESVFFRAIQYSAHNNCQDSELHMKHLTCFGFLLLHKKKFEQCSQVLGRAVDIFRSKSLKVDSEFLRVFNALTCCYLEERDFLKAVTYASITYEESLKINGTNHLFTRQAKEVFETTKYIAVMQACVAEGPPRKPRANAQSRSNAQSRTSTKKSKKDTTDCGPSITSAEISKPLCAGRQCMTRASFLACLSRARFTW